MPYCTIPNYTILYNSAPYHTISYCTILYNSAPYHTISYYSYHTIPYHTVTYHIVLYHTIPYCTIPYHIVPYHTMLCHTVILYPFVILQHTDKLISSDIDECESNKYICGYTGLCVNTIGNYLCECPPGETLIGNRCIGTFYYVWHREQQRQKAN